MSFYVLIPARLESSRLKNKMLLDLQGIPLVIRTALQAQHSSAEKVFIATDSECILQVAQQYNIPAVRTQAHATGTDRIAAAAQTLGLEAEEIIINVQGDEPLIDPALINQVAQQLQNDPKACMSTAAAPLTDHDSFFNPNIVKVVCNAQQQALYFSRAPIPWARDQFDAAQNKAEKPAPCGALQHIGIYAYKNHFLQRFPRLSPGVLEQLESLEQLRALEHGYAITVYSYPNTPPPGVDTADDLRKVRELIALKPNIYQPKPLKP